LKSLEELDASRAGYSDAARAVLVQANGQVNQQGAIADYLEVARGYERAVEACLGDLLQHVVVERPEHAAAGFHLVRDAGAGRCGFLITSAVEAPVASGAFHAAIAVTGHASGIASAAAALGSLPDGVVALSSVMQVNGPYAQPIRQAIGEAAIAPSYKLASDVSHLTPLPVVTGEGEVFRGPHLVNGGGHAEARGILETKREIRELRERIASERSALQRLSQETAELEGTIAQASNAISALNAEYHKQEKAAVAHDAQLTHAGEEVTRLAQKADQLAREKRQAEDERDALDRRQDEARTSITQLEAAQREADDRLPVAQGRLFEAGESLEELSHQAADSGAAHAALVERAAALTLEVQRMEEAGAELEQRAAALATELGTAQRRIGELRETIAAGEVQLDTDVAALDGLRQQVMTTEDTVAALRARADEHDGAIKDARAALDAIRRVVADLDIARATAEADLSHLAYTCEDAVGATLDEVIAEMDRLEAGGPAPPAGSGTDG